MSTTHSHYTMQNSLYPKISIIIGVRNMFNTLEKALLSVINQQYPNLELIVMDGGSTDGTQDIIKKYDSFITYWQSQPDKGHPDACNKAIDYASGDIIGFLNADDFYQPKAFEKVADCYRQHPNVDIISCGTRIIKQDNQGNERILQDFNHPQKLALTLRNMLFEFTAFNGKFYRKNIFDRYGKFIAHDENGHLNRSNDREFLIRLTLQPIYSEVIPESLYVYLSHQQASSFNKNNLERIHNEHLSLAKKLLKLSTISSSQKALIKTWWARESVYLFLTMCRQGNTLKAAQAIKDGLISTHWRWMKEFVFYTLKKLSRKGPHKLSS